MIVVMTSDTHNLHLYNKMPEVPEGDVLVHCGDATMGGRRSEIKDFARWLCLQKHKRKVFVPGNHDWFFQRTLSSRHAWASELPGVDVLVDDEVVIDGVKFWGSPYQPEFMNWAFNVPASSRKFHFSKMPWDVDVLITHCPPERILDEVPSGENVGCPELAKIVLERKPKVHCFGHIHHSYGHWNDPVTGIKFYNCAMASERYIPVNPPHVVEL